jgi:hypoxanthine phosphoribosyltransferase
MVGVLKGGFVFLSDLMRHMDIPVYIDMIGVSSYGADTKSSGIVQIVRDIDINISGRNVIIVEDIIDTGLTLKYLIDLFKTRKPALLKVCAAFDKPSRRKIMINSDYDSIVIPDRFVVGYGLDYMGMYRNLPDLCTLKPHIFTEKSSGDCICK